MLVVLMVLPALVLGDEYVGSVNGATLVLGDEYVGSVGSVNGAAVLVLGDEYVGSVNGATALVLVNYYVAAAFCCGGC